MLPDFRFLVGALLATVLLAVTGVGLLAAVKIAHEARVGPLELSRSLAFAPEHGRLQFRDAMARFGMPPLEDPFAGIPRDVPTRNLAPAEVVAQAHAMTAAPEPAPAEAAASPADDTDTVDERAVVDPPLPADGTQVIAEPSTVPEPAAPPVAESATKPTPEPAQPAAAAVEPAAAQPNDPPTVDVEHVGSLPPTAPEALPEPSVTDAAVIDAPIEEAPSAETPSVEMPSADTPSVGAAMNDSAAADPGIIDTLGDRVQPRPAQKAEPKAKARAAKAPAAKAAKKASAKKAPAKKAKAKPRRTARTVVQQPVASSGYSLTWLPTPVFPQISTVKPFWP